MPTLRAHSGRVGEQVDATTAQTMAMLPLSVIFLSLQPHSDDRDLAAPRGGRDFRPEGSPAKTIGMDSLSLPWLLIRAVARPRFQGTLAGHPNFALIDRSRVAYGAIVAGALL